MYISVCYETAQLLKMCLMNIWGSSAFSCSGVQQH